MRILFISSYPPEKGGIPNYTKTLIHALQGILRNHDDVHVICTRQLCQKEPSSKDSATKNLFIIDIPTTTPLHYTISLIKNVIRLRPNIIHIQYPLLLTLRQRIRRLGPLCEPLYFLLIFLRLLYHIPTVVTMHEVWSLTEARDEISMHIRSASLASILTGYFTLFMTRFLRTIGAVITLTDYGKKILKAQYGISEKKVRVHPHGIDIVKNFDVSHITPKFSINKHHVILFFGYIWPAKGIEYLIKAMPHILRRIKDAQLIIAGPLNPVFGDQYLERLLSIRTKLKLNNYVHIDARYVPENELPLYFSVATLVVVPYNVAVGSSGPVHLAFAFKKPVVSTNVGCRNEELGAGARGLLVPPRSPKELADAICQVMTDEALRTTMKRNIEQYIEENNWTALAKKTLDEYKRMNRVVSHACA